MQIVLRLARQVEIDDLRDARHVDAAGRDVGRHQRTHAAAAQLRQRPVALALVHVAMQRSRRMAFVLQLVGERLGVALGRDEDDALSRADVGKQPVEQPVLVRAIIGEMHALLDGDRAMTARR